MTTSPHPAHRPGPRLNRAGGDALIASLRRRRQRMIHARCRRRRKEAMLAGVSVTSPPDVGAIGLSRFQPRINREVDSTCAAAALAPVGRKAGRWRARLGARARLRLRTGLRIRFASRPRPRPRPSSSSSKFPAKPRAKDEGQGGARGNHTIFRHALRLRSGSRGPDAAVAERRRLLGRRA
jgi:hypothetical protein